MREWILLMLLVCGCSRARVEEHRAALAISQVPEKVLQTAHKKFPEVKFDTAWKLDTGAIEVRGKTKTGRIHEVEVSDAGEIVEAE
jgi:hypothetical protein